MEVTLTDGRKILVDLAKLSHKEYVNFWTQTATEDERSAILKKWIGLNSEEVEDLPEADWRAVKNALQAVSFVPIKEDLKNSPSASTLPPRD